MRSALLVLLAACGPSDIDRARAAKLFKEVVVETAPGLSGLASDDGGGIWSVAERSSEAYRITLDAGLVPTVTTFAIEGTPRKLDLEGIAWLGGDRFAFGTEGREDEIATVLFAERRDRVLAVTSTITLPAARLGIRLPANHGAEGICGAGDAVFVAIEGAGTADGRRFAPIVRLDAGAIARTHRVWLTTTTGKLSALDCTVAADGTADAIAIERHFEVTKILRFTIPAADGDITPIEALDLGPILKSRLNLEGIARTPGGRTVAVVDNQWKAITGPSTLLVFEPTAIK